LENKKVITSVITESEITTQLAHLGLRKGMVVEVHSSLSSLGYVVSGAGALVNALLASIGEEGTIVMPAQDSDNTEPLNWVNPPVELRLVDKIRDNTIGYDIYTSGLHQMGAVADDLRARKNTYHSYHPSCGFMANGALAKELMSNQPINFALGPKSPLGKMYELDNAYILLIGVDYEKATGMHLGEYLSERRKIKLEGGAVKKDGATIWKKYLEIDLDSDEFAEVGKRLEKAKLVRIGKVGEAKCKLVRFKDAVDFTRDYLMEKY